jgi:hypothetical protein
MGYRCPLNRCYLAFFLAELVDCTRVGIYSYHTRLHDENSLCLALILGLVGLQEKARQGVCQCGLTLFEKDECKNSLRY